MKKKKFRKVVAVFLALNILFESLAPTAAYALTGGPSQPEVESFEPVGTNQMVDLFSGDFNYNIPLIDVPGPNGGYPLNLSYHAGIGMEQEASWVGLGWNINVGEINRMMRGLPDDFKNAKIKKTVHSKPNNTFSVGIGIPLDIKTKEFFGFRIHTTSAAYQLYYNNYKGVGNTISMQLSTNEKNAASSHWATSLALSLDSYNGIGVNPSISYYQKGRDHANAFHLGIGYSTKEGINGVNLKHQRFSVTRRNYKDLGRIDYGSNTGGGSGVNFSSGSFVPHVDMPQFGLNVRMGLEFGSDNLFQYDRNFGLNASLSMQWGKKSAVPFDACGYLYNDNATTASMRDMNREKDVAPTKDVPSLSIPVHTYDTWFIKGQGVSAVFRPYRNDVPVLSDPSISNAIPGTTLNGELATVGTTAHFGGAIGLNLNTYSSGTWSGQDANLTDHFGTVPTTTATPYLNEAVYFKASGDLSEGTPLATTFLNEEAVSQNLKLQYTGISLKPKIQTDLHDKNGGTYTPPSGKISKTTREKRNQQFEYLTNKQLTDLGDYPNGMVEIWDANKYPYFNRAAGDSLLYTYNREAESSMANSAYNSQVGSVSVLNPDGNRYYYSLPAYNFNQKEVLFSTQTAENFTEHDLEYGYASTGTHPENSVENKYGNDHLYSSVETPAYAHSYLLTAIVSPDFVDLTGNGPSEDDLGYYTKFNYTRIDNYKWRIPYGTNKANLNMGAISSQKDDKASYTYGEKELYFLNSVETKTHIAVFKLNEPGGAKERKDGYGAFDENNSTPASGTKQYSLESIELFSKKDILYCQNQSPAITPKPIKMVHFEYETTASNQLCQSVDNGATNYGKLTLKKVWFTYQGNTKGSLSPYQFDYHVSDINENPSYKKERMDRWGNFKRDDFASGTFEPIAGLFNSENPYVNQNEDYNGVGGITSADKTLRDQHAGVWSLKSITLPSGGVIDINYESDDYSHVQDKRAMEMTEITAVGGSSGTTSNKLTNDNNRIYFKLDEPICTSATGATARLKEYGAKMTKLYFKTFQKLKKYHAANPGPYDFAWDYVEGYANVKYNAGEPIMGFGNVGAGDFASTGYIEVETESVAGKNIHPFRFAGWQYLRMQRPDLFGPANDFGGAVWSLHPLTQVITQLKNAVQLLTGYYSMCWIGGYCKEISIDQSGWKSAYHRPSYIRLNTPDGIKYGGGHRVKKITISDKWSEMVNSITPGGNGNESGPSVFGQEYIYRMPDGKSSGVAEYEPLIGGEEIPHHLPVKYSSSKFLVNDKALYLEEPYGESFYPSASVGYRRVIVKNLDVSGVTKNTEGITISEFYTAKEFPVFVDYTSVADDDHHKKYWLMAIIPFLGTMSFNNRGFSQGYKIELNDMHGKPKSVATYASTVNYNMANTHRTKIEYFYKTKTAFDSEQANYLDNSVDVLDGDANYRTATLGVGSDFYMDLRENSSTSTLFDLQPNAELNGVPPSAMFTVVPTFEYSEAMFRSAVTVKVLQKNGILVKTESYDNGSKVTTENKMFDAQTGAVLLSSVTNDWDKPVYYYKYAAHWNYDKLGSSSKNWGAVVPLTVSTSGICDFAQPGDVFNVGDELVKLNAGEFTSEKYWVSEVNDLAPPSTDNIHLIKEDGSTSFTAGALSVKVIRSGRRNQQGITNGSIVSLSNPVTTRNFPLFTALNTELSSSPNYTFTYNDCVTGNEKTVSIGWDALTNQVEFTASGCKTYIKFPDSYVPSGVSDFNNLVFSKHGNVVKVKTSTGTLVSYGIWKDANMCHAECMDDVLHADAIRFAEGWVFNYGDIGEPEVKYRGASPPVAISSEISGAHNPYRIGTMGIWRSLGSYAYQVDRKQTATHTDISKDGTYKHFVPYNWEATIENNSNWSTAERITQYSPYGYQLEGKDTIGIYSSAMYGYDNSLNVAMASNARYMEIGFDGFEDYLGFTYPQTVGSGSWGHGHMVFTESSGYPSITSGASHTGAKSLVAGTINPVEFTTTASTTYSQTATTFKPIAGKEYYVSMWIKSPANLNTGHAELKIKVNGTAVTTINTSKDDVIIEGWHLISAKIPALLNTDQLKISLKSTDVGNSVINIDDIRLQPFKSGMQTNVYDPVTLKLVAQLDDQNFATFYNYDEEGKLVQVKKETEKGIITIRSSRDNIKR
jgi:hypothetical protein